MSRFASLGLRGAVALAGGGAMLSGMVFAFRGDSVAPNGVTQAAVLPASETATMTPQAVIPASNTSTPTVTVQADASPEETSVLSAPTATPRPMTQVVAPAPTWPIPVSDIPKYTDVAVLALAADFVLPSGRTFRECVELPPSHERWPSPVHLYYEGKGKWLVETHVSEVQVVFDEATGLFSGRNFAPTSPECLKPG